MTYAKMWDHMFNEYDIVSKFDFDVDTDGTAIITCEGDVPECLQNLLCFESFEENGKTIVLTGVMVEP